jgi:hypothetical protein
MKSSKGRQEKPELSKPCNTYRWKTSMAPSPMNSHGFGGDYFAHTARRMEGGENFESFGLEGQTAKQIPNSTIILSSARCCNMRLLSPINHVNRSKTPVALSGPPDPAPTRFRKMGGDLRPVSRWACYLIKRPAVSSKSKLAEISIGKHTPNLQLGDHPSGF